MNAVGIEQAITDLAERGCAEFCVNGQFAAAASRPASMRHGLQEPRSSQRTAAQPAGQDWTFEVCQGQDFKGYNDGAS